MRIGHTHLKVRDLEKSVGFYKRYLRLEERERIGETFSFLSGTDMHHEIALQQLGASASSPRPDTVGLYHVAFEAKSKDELRQLYERLVADGIPHVLVDHRISVAIYFADPDQNGLEVYQDTRSEVNGSRLWQGIDRPISAESYFEGTGRGVDDRHGA
ncbi:MAG: VOC family protein [Opitutales bacterium]